METGDVSLLCRRVEDATEAIRDTFEEQISETVERFWWLQDTLAHLVAGAHGWRNEAFTVMDREHQGLVQSVVYLLSSAEAVEVSSRSPAVKATIDAINSLLRTLQNARQSIELFARRASS